jgi:hypothetical protein
VAGNELFVAEPQQYGWLHDLAAFVQIAKEGEKMGEGLLVDRMNGRWIRI